MRKILIFSLAYYPHVGGAEVAVKELTDRMLDIEFHMVTMRFSAADSREEKIGNVLVHRVGNGASYISKILFIPRAAFLALKLDVQNFDGMWAMMSYMTFPIALVRIFCRVNVPYVLTLQEGDPFETVFNRWYIKLFSPLLSYGFKHASVVTAISNFLALWAQNAGFVGSIHVIPNGVDIQKFSGELKPHEGTVLITASRLVHKNAIDDVLRALPLLPQNVVFKILGTGPEEATLKTLAKKEGVESRVEFLGHVDHAQLPGMLHAADIFIRPSRSEGMGNAFIEAMAAGLPIIATAVGGIPDFLQDGETGFVIDVDSPQNIAAVVKSALQNPEETKRIAHAGQELSKSYEWGILAERMRKEVFEPLWQKK
ncbi:MAG: glycosyltransferase family 4 protein [Candidatus Adlerbacteria bacterium]